MLNDLGPDNNYNKMAKQDMDNPTSSTHEDLNNSQCIDKHSEMLNNKKIENKLLNQDEKYPELTIQMFFGFMRTAYQINDNIDELSSVLAANSEINWAQLTKIDLNFQSGNNKNVGTDEVDIETNQDKKLLVTQINQQLLHDDTELCQQEKDYKNIDNHGDNTLKSTETYSPIKKSKGQKNDSALDTKEHSLGKLLKKNLGDILHEGLLDSVLPYMLPKPIVSQPIIKKPIMNIDAKKTTSSAVNSDKSATLPSANRDKDKEKNKGCKKSPEIEVEIHVCDEAKNIKKDFRCPQKLLVQKMCYFADVTAGQKLEEMDISVHCDIVIFDWLMRWVKKDIIKKSEWPLLEANNVIPITVSASFLQMEPLLEQCLVFCHENMSDVLKTSTILTCLNDNIFTRLADLFTNVDVETLKDKKDKVQSRLFCKLIIALTNPTPDNNRGHYSSLATLFKCGKCGKHVIRSVSDIVPCIPNAMKIDSKGNVHSKHSRDLTWSLNEYISTLRSEMRSWRKVYWRLWGDCHFLYCRQCHTYFSIHQMDWCSYHPDTPQFFANEQQKSAPFPLGRYPCCSQRAYRFEALPNREGCRFKEHIPVISHENDGHILNIYTIYRDVISQEPPQLFFPEKITRLAPRDSSLQPGKLLCKETMWWDGIELATPRPKLGLLGRIWGGAGVRKPCQLPDVHKNSRKLRSQSSQNADISSYNSSDSDSDDDDVRTACGDSSVDDDSDHSEESHGWRLFKPAHKIKHRYNATKRNDGARSWNMNLAVRYNQDNQRDFEERAALQMIALLTKRTSAEKNNHTKLNKQSHGCINQPLGGTYVKLEAEFREQSHQSYKMKNTSHVKGPTRTRSSKA
ncbi:hypothetical protein PV326_009031 [Microctonus aethiopoides]|nr:hypothetical protein PV326_009031 [Microctonus aethiopoides]